MKNYTLLLVFVALLASCKKDNSTTPSTNNGALTTGSWKFTAVTVTIDWPQPLGPQEVNGLDLLPACDVDNIFTFHTDNTLTIDEGATKCDPTGPQIRPGGTWSLTNNNSKFSATYDNTTISADVLTLDNSTFKIKYITTENGINATHVATYGRP